MMIDLWCTSFFVQLEKHIHIEPARKYCEVVTCNSGKKLVPERQDSNQLRNSSEVGIC